MNATRAYVLWRLSPVVLLMLAAGFWFNDVQQGGPNVVRNLVPLGILIVLAWFALYRGEGRWAGAGLRYPLAALGYAIPALGLSSYLHYAYAVNLNDMFTDVAYPERIFRYLPLYTIGAGAIGYAIGWIVGRNV